MLLRKSVPADGQGGSPLPPPREGRLHLPLSRKPSQKVNDLLSCVPGNPQIPAFALSVSRPSATPPFYPPFPSMQCTCALYQAHWLCSKSTNFRNVVWPGPVLILWGKVSYARTDEAFAQRGSHTKAKELGVWSQVQPKASLKVSGGPQEVFLPLC